MSGSLTGERRCSASRCARWLVGGALLAAACAQIAAAAPAMGFSAWVDRCVRVPPGHNGTYRNKTCTEIPNEEATNSVTPYESEVLERKGFTLAGAATSFETASARITCSALAADGEYTGNQTAAIGPVTLTGCTVLKGAERHASCQSAGSEAGEVVTGPLVGHLGAHSPGKIRAGIELAPASGETFAAFSCGAETVAITGAVIFEVPYAKPATTAKWVAKQKKGVQAFPSFDDGSDAALQASFSGNAAEPIGLEARPVQTTEEAVETSVGDERYMP
jgi:hypothetical protein